MVWRYLTWRPVITLLIIGGVAVGAGLMSAVLTLRKAVDEMFLRDSSLYDMVVGGKGSPLQLVLSSIYHIDFPTGNIPFSMLEEIRANQKVDQAVPISLGDQIGGFRIVGTDRSAFDFTERGSKMPLLPFASGRAGAKPFEAVLGAEATRGTGLKLGDSFFGVHGLVEGIGSERHENAPYTVVGILETTGTALDRVVLTPLESVWLAHEEKRSAGEAREITSILLTLKTPGLRLWLADQIQRESPAVAAIPLMQMLRLQQRLLNPLTRVLLLISILVVGVSVVSITISMILTADRRQRDWRILRNLGATPRQILTLLFFEALALSFSGVFLGAGAVRVAARSFDGAAFGLPGLQAAALRPSPEEALILALVVLLGVAASFLPAWAAYRNPPEVR